MIIVDLNKIYSQSAKLSCLPEYIDAALNAAGIGKEVIITGQAPIWLYLSIAHALHGKANKLIYRSPVAGDVLIFDHDPF